MKRQWIAWVLVVAGLMAPALSQADRHDGGQQRAQAERGRQERPRMLDYSRQRQYRKLGAGLTPDQRRELRRDVDKAGSKLYRNQGRGRGTH
jgi:hypothetical protein